MNMRFMTTMGLCAVISIAGGLVAGDTVSLKVPIGSLSDTSQAPTSHTLEMTPDELTALKKCFKEDVCGGSDGLSLQCTFASVESFQVLKLYSWCLFHKEYERDWDRKAGQHAFLNHYEEKLELQADSAGEVEQNRYEKALEQLHAGFVAVEKSGHGSKEFARQREGFYLYVQDILQTWVQRGGLIIKLPHYKWFTDFLYSDDCESPFWHAALTPDRLWKETCLGVDTLIDKVLECHKLNESLLKRLCAVRCSTRNAHPDMDSKIDSHFLECLEKAASSYWSNIEKLPILCAGVASYKDKGLRERIFMRVLAGYDKFLEGNSDLNTQYGGDGHVDMLRKLAIDCGVYSEGSIKPFKQALHDWYWELPQERSCGWNIWRVKQLLEGYETRHPRRAAPQRPPSGAAGADAQPGKSPIGSSGRTQPRGSVSFTRWGIYAGLVCVGVLGCTWLFNHYAVHDVSVEQDVLHS